MDYTNTIIVSVALALIYVFIIKPRQDRKAAESGKREGHSPESGQVDYVKELETILYDYCERTKGRRPSYPLEKWVNFQRNLNLDGIDVAEIRMLFEKKFPFRVPDDHPFNQRNADDTDFTVENFLSAYGL